MTKIYVFIGTLGFFLAAGAAGGIEQDTMAWKPGLILIAAGFGIMWACALLARRTK